jgi:hypothetical protein
MTSVCSFSSSNIFVLQLHIVQLLFIKMFAQAYKNTGIGNMPGIARLLWAPIAIHELKVKVAKSHKYPEFFQWCRQKALH